MSNNAVILCGGIEKEAQDGQRPPIKLSLWGQEPNIYLKIGNLTDKMSASVPPLFMDLLEIAAYVFSADQAVTRGANGVGNLGENWRRNFNFYIPVREPKKWNQKEVKEALIEVLNFLSEDNFDFIFEKLEQSPPEQSYFEYGEERFESIDEVLLFSGGLDSLGGAVQEVVVNKKKVAIVSHRSAPKISSKLSELVKEFNAHCNGNKPLHVPVWLQKKEKLSRESSQRSRSFVYACLAATVAVMLNLNHFKIYENGIVSLNLPISEQLIGARATRTTHPQVIKGFSRLFSALIENDFKVEHPFIWKTKAEVVEVIKKAGCADLIKRAVSCSGVYHRTNLHTHCGTCMQCIDRRFGILAAGCEEYDPEERYEVDLLTGAREEGESITIAESYVRTALEIEKMPEEDFFSRFGEASRVLRHLDGTANEVAEKIIDLHKRHGREVGRVLKEGIKRNAKFIVNEELPQNCLLILSLPSKYRIQDKSLGEQKEKFSHSADYRSVKLDGEKFALTASQAAIIKILHENYQNDTPEVSQAFLSEILDPVENLDLKDRRIRDIFRKSKAWGILIIKGEKKGTFRLNL